MALETAAAIVTVTVNNNKHVVADAPLARLTTRHVSDVT